MVDVTAGIASPPVVVPRPEHNISRQQIDDDTLKVLYRLNRHGYRALLVGGCVRDLLLGRQPKDFDVATDATPNQVKKLFRNCFLVGRRFRLAHIRFAGGNLIEVATFRREATAADLPDDENEHRHAAENVFGTPAEDAFRRDFTINSLFYDIADFSLIDYTGGLQDLVDRKLRVIGDPWVRFAEDPVRMLRALEFAARLDFTLGSRAKAALREQATLIETAAPARIRDEFLELLRHRVAGEVLRAAAGCGLLGPLLNGYDGDETTYALFDQLDRRPATEPVAEGAALALLFLTRFRAQCNALETHSVAAAAKLAGQLLTPHCAYFHIANGIRHHARELLVGCYRLAQGRGQRGENRFLRNPFTAEALRLYALFSIITGVETEIVSAWQQAAATTRAPVGISTEPGAARPPRRRRRRRKSTAPKAQD